MEKQTDTKQKMYDKHCINLGKHILDVERSIGEPIIFTLHLDKGKHQILSIETIKGIRFKQKLQYDGSSDYDESEGHSNDPFERGII